MKKKFFGGYLSLRQVTYLMLAASSLALFATPMPKILTIFIVIAIVTLFLLFSFLKIGEQNFDKFFFFAIKYIFRKRKFAYRRCGTCQ